MSLGSVIADMEYHGLLIDEIKLAIYENTLEQKMAEHLREIENYIKDTVYIKSKGSFLVS